jgi:glutamate synthase domain-containing protein 2
MWMQFGRYSAFAACIGLLVLALALLPLGWPLVTTLIVLGGFVLTGVYDVMQSSHAVLRNYPIIGHVRYILEFVRPEIRQYLLEGDEDAVPFSRQQRALIYRRAKGVSSDQPFGTMKDVYGAEYEYLQHSARPTADVDPASFRIVIGNDQCARPYSASIFNISAMSFGALSAAAISALNQGAAKGGFYHDTGEGGISPYHIAGGGDLIWEVASGYFGCRSLDGKFDPQQFEAKACSPQVKMIEIKLSQGAKPGHGGVLPKIKLTPEIAATRGVAMDQDCISPARHSTFTTPLEMMDFIAQLRSLSGGKPVGLKMCIGHPWEFMGMVKAMLQTGIVPDFIVIDGGEGGTGAAPQEFSDHVGTPLREGLRLVHNTLVGAGLRDKMKIGVAGRVNSAFGIASLLALGADWVNAARAFMFALGCIQSLSCHTNHCPTGVATQDKRRQKALKVPNKADRVYQFHKRTVEVLAEMISAAGLYHPDDLMPHHLVHRLNATEVCNYADMHYFMEPNALLDGTAEAFYIRNWDMAQAESFSPMSNRSKNSNFSARTDHIRRRYRMDRRHIQMSA